MSLCFAGVAAAMLGICSLLSGRPSNATQIPAPPPAPPVLQAVPISEAPADPPAVSTEGLVLYGVSGGGAAGMAALIGPPSGYPRIVPVGKEYRPGLMLKEIGPTHALLVSSGQETTLHLGRRTASPLSQPPESIAASARPIGGSPPGLQGMDSAALRLGMRPRRKDGRITGFELKQSRELAPLQRAGLKAGDVIVAVNGQAFTSEEKLMELPQEIAGSFTAEFEIDRDGRRMKLSLPVNQHPQ